MFLNTYGFVHAHYIFASNYRIKLYSQRIMWFLWVSVLYKLLTFHDIIHSYLAAWVGLELVVQCGKNCDCPIHPLREVESQSCASRLVCHPFVGQYFMSWYNTIWHNFKEMCVSLSSMCASTFLSFYSRLSSKVLPPVPRDFHSLILHLSRITLCQSLLSSVWVVFFLSHV